MGIEAETSVASFHERSLCPDLSFCPDLWDPAVVTTTHHGPKPSWPKPLRPRPLWPQAIVPSWRSQSIVAGTQVSQFREGLMVVIDDVGELHDAREEQVKLNLAIIDTNLERY